MQNAIEYLQTELAKEVDVEFVRQAINRIIPLVAEDAQLTEVQAQQIGDMLNNPDRAFIENWWMMIDFFALGVATYINSCHR